MANSPLIRTPQYLAFSLGFSAFLPHGLSYLLLFAMTAWLLGLPKNWSSRTEIFQTTRIGWILLAFTAWPFVVTLFTPWGEDTATRLFHMVRVTWILMIGLMATSQERRFAFRGFLWGAIFATLVIAIHYLVQLPPWGIWYKLITVTGSQSSRTMIMLAVAAGAALWMALKTDSPTKPRLAWIALCLAFSTVVAIHSVSRNAHLVLLSMPMAVIVYRMRLPRALLWAALAGTACLLIVWNFSSSVHTRFTSAYQELASVISTGDCNSSVGVRWSMFQTAWDGMWSHPLIGTGVGSFAQQWGQGSINCPELVGIRQPHNDFLLFGLETGLIGLGLTITLMVWFMITNWRNNSHSGAIGFLLSLGLIITTLVNSPMRDAGIGFVMLWLMAVAVFKKNGSVRV